ncbi:hypothetical protein D5086_028613 [Populus alba]|uniref:Uncharacterized protein n=1 Tax=Populus alba TaxID=43335 RepID=A0ACC4AR47_POPAL
MKKEVHADDNGSQEEAGHDDEEDGFLKTRARVEEFAEDFLAILQARRVIHRTKLRNRPHCWALEVRRMRARSCILYDFSQIRYNSMGLAERI